MGKIYGWEVYDYLISKTAQNPEDDYTLEYNIVPSVAFGRENTGDYGKRFGVKEPIKRYIEVADRISKQLGYEVIKYMGIKPDLSGYTGVEVESPVLPGRYDLGNTKRAELTGKQLGSGMTLLNTLEESLDNFEKKIGLYTYVDTTEADTSNVPPPYYINPFEEEENETDTKK